MIKIKTKEDILRDLKERCDKSGEDFSKYEDGGILSPVVNDLADLWTKTGEEYEKEITETMSAKSMIALSASSRPSFDGIMQLIESAAKDGLTEINTGNISQDDIQRLSDLGFDIYYGDDILTDKPGHKYTIKW